MLCEPGVAVATIVNKLLVLNSCCNRGHRALFKNSNTCLKSDNNFLQIMKYGRNVGIKKNTLVYSKNSNHIINVAFESTFVIFHHVPALRCCLTSPYHHTTFNNCYFLLYHVRFRWILCFKHFHRLSLTVQNTNIFTNVLYIPFVQIFDCLRLFKNKC